MYCVFGPVLHCHNDVFLSALGNSHHCRKNDVLQVPVIIHHYLHLFTTTCILHFCVFLGKGSLVYRMCSTLVSQFQRHAENYFNKPNF